ncbi:pre-rRNA processing protein [Coemansia sp. RSA 552]|nr:pre-rRNA processing protein [Coemansia sp. RSA 552]
MAKDRFLARGVASTKRQRNGKPAASQAAKPSRRAAGGRHNGRSGGSGSEPDDSVGNVDDLEHRFGADTDEASSEDEDELLETAAEKRLRLARDYIDRVKASTELDSGEYDAEQIDRDLIAERLMTDAQERSGKWSRQIAAHFAYPIEEGKNVRVLKGGHRLPTTSVALTPNGRFVYSGSKDGSLVKWDRATGAKLKVFAGQKKSAMPRYDLGHCDHILAVAVSSDGKYVATGGRDRRIHIWSVGEDRHLGVFHQHKDVVTGLVFRRGINHLYSCSADRMVKLWNIDDMGYMDTLFGHQDGIVSIDALHREQAVTTGARDKTVRLWKIADEAQLVFRAGSATDQTRITKALVDEASEDGAARKAELEPNSRVRAETNSYADMLRGLAKGDSGFSEECVDCVAMVDEETFVTGGDSGALSLWSIHKKKPTFIHHVSHGVTPGLSDNNDGDNTGDDEPMVPRRPHWITALASVPFTDLFVSASSDGLIRMWQLRPGKNPGFDLRNVIPASGFVNALAVRELAPADPLSTKKDIVLAAALGQEPRLGRWEKRRARNVVKVFHLPYATTKSHT